MACRVFWDPLRGFGFPRLLKMLSSDMSAWQIDGGRPRQPAFLRMDTFDLSMIKRLARNKGVPHTQLMAIWLREWVQK